MIVSFAGLYARSWKMPCAPTPIASLFAFQLLEALAGPLYRRTPHVDGVGLRTVGCGQFEMNFCSTCRSVFEVAKSVSAVASV